MLHHVAGLRTLKEQLRLQGSLPCYATADDIDELDGDVWVEFVVDCLEDTILVEQNEESPEVGPLTVDVDNLEPRLIQILANLLGQTSQ